MKFPRINAHITDWIYVFNKESGYLKTSPDPGDKHQMGYKSIMRTDERVYRG